MAFGQERFSLSETPCLSSKPSALDFFAGSGLVSEGLQPFFSVVWANDFSDKKAAVYRANHGGQHFQLGSVETVSGSNLPDAVLSWASFPCQDLSLAGGMRGINASRSGLVWHWLRVMDEMRSRAPLVVAENVLGLVSTDQGQHYRTLHSALVKRGYRVGAFLLNAAHWVPQSRPRVFVVGVDQSVNISDLQGTGPGWHHSLSIQKAGANLPGWVWWKLPRPMEKHQDIERIIDFDAPCHDAKLSNRNVQMIPPRHMEMLRLAINGRDRAFPGYKRTRSGRQVLEVRFDGLAGCLRTPAGGSSRQLVVIKRCGGRLDTRLLTVKEASRLMGVRSDYKIPGSYNDGYKAMGDAVVVPIVRHLARYLLMPIADRISR